METFEKAKLEILNYVIIFCTNTLYDGDKYMPPFTPGSGFTSGSSFTSNPPLGSLIRLMAAPFTKWYLSWLIEIDNKQSGYLKYLLKSIEDGSLSWWENVGVYYMPLELSDQFPQWKFNDKQYVFWGKWKKAAKWEKVYILIPLRPVFNELNVTLELRKRYSDDIVGCKTFPNWGKLTIREMREFIRETADKLKQ
ncbi:hypothetical protein [Parabacteroides goldsteinii]|uniref:hypothetical protein n=1 Tax=Parabacteroides goldsteinii TaxID=328812 RepID=UPI0032B256C9